MKFCGRHIPIKMVYNANYVIIVEMVGVLEGKITDLSNPLSHPCHCVEFLKSRTGKLSKYLFFESMLMCIDGGAITDKIITHKTMTDAAKIAIADYHRGKEYTCV